MEGQATEYVALMQSYEATTKTRKATGIFLNVAILALCLVGGARLLWHNQTWEWPTIGTTTGDALCGSIIFLLALDWFLKRKENALLMQMDEYLAQISGRGETKQATPRIEIATQKKQGASAFNSIPIVGPLMAESPLLKWAVIAFVALFALEFLGERAVDLYQKMGVAQAVVEKTKSEQTIAKQQECVSLLTSPDIFGGERQESEAYRRAGCSDRH